MKSRTIQRTLQTQFKLSLKLFFVVLSVLFMNTVFAQSSNYQVNGIGKYIEFQEVTLLIQLELPEVTTNTTQIILNDSPKRLILTLAKAKSARQMRSFWSQYLALNHTSEQLAVYQKELKRLKKSWGNGFFKQGDSFSFERQNSNSTLIKLNEKRLMRSKQEGFFEFLLEALIGEVPASEQIKQALSSAGSINKNTLVLAQMLRQAAPKNKTVVVDLPALSDKVVSNPMVTSISKKPPKAKTAPVKKTLTKIQAPKKVTTLNKPASSQFNRVKKTAKPLIPTPLKRIPYLTEPSEKSHSKAALEAIKRYQTYVQQLISAQVKYPKALKRKRLRGKIQLILAIAKDGTLIGIGVLSKSGHKPIDEAAVAAVSAASPFVQPPDEVLEFPLIFGVELNIKP